MARTIVESLSGVRSDARLVHAAVINMEGNNIIYSGITNMEYKMIKKKTRSLHILSLNI